MTVPPLIIGAVRIETPVVLAPMAGYTDSVMRSLCKRFGCGLVYTEVVNADGIARESKPTLALLKATPDQRPSVAHIYGSDPEVMAWAATVIERLDRFDIIDVNCGCPVPKIVAKGAGVALMKKPERIGEIVRAIRAAVKLPVTIKTRIGIAPSRMNVSEVAQAAQEAGAAAIAIHCRFASGRHSSQPEWPLLRQMKSELTIPVIGNGGIHTAADIPRMFAETGVDGVMIGKAAIGNPWIFQETVALLSGQPRALHSLEERRALIEEHLRGLVAQKTEERKDRRRNRVSPEEASVLHFRAFLCGYIRGIRGASEFKRHLQEFHTIDDVLRAVDGALALGREPR